MTFYDKYFFCSMGQHFLPKHEGTVDKGGFLACPIHGRRLRTHPAKRGIHK